MPLLEHDGCPIYYEVHGRGPALLLTHGYGATSRMWRPQIPALSERYTVVVWDIRGHGQSGAPDDSAAYSREVSLADMAALLDAAGAERAAVGGLSLGGYLSLAFHTAHPDRVGALLLFDTGPGYRNAEARQQWNEMAERRAQRFEERGLAALGQSAEVRESTNSTPAGLARAARGILTQHDAVVIDALPNVAVPTLVLVGGNDTQYLAPTEYMATKIPGAQKVVIDGAGHAANLDAPEDFNKAVLAFLEGVGWG